MERIQSQETDVVYDVKFPLMGYRKKIIRLLLLLLRVITYVSVCAVLTNFVCKMLSK